MVQINWGLAQNGGQNALQMFDFGSQLGQQARARRDDNQRREALAGYAANPSPDGLNALAPYAPDFVLKERGRIETDERDQLEKRLKVVGNAAQWADTPEKWDAAIDQLSAAYPDLAEYKGKFSPETRMAAIAAGSDIDAFMKRMQPVNVGPGSHLVDPITGEAKFSAPFAPRPVTVGEGQTVVEYAPGVPGGGGITDPSTIFGRMIGAESNGQQFAANGQPLTSPAGAIGIAQVMPGTAPEAAQLAGLPFDENRYRTDPEYNAALGKAYFEKQLKDFGDPALAVAAYNAGPGAVRNAQQQGGANWIQHVPKETQNYVAKVLGGGGAQNGPRIIAQGAPKQEKPDKAPAGYQWKPDGTLAPIPGGPADKPENRPENKEAYSQSAIDSFDRAIKSGNDLLKHPGMSTAVGVKGLTGGLLGGWVVPGSDAADFVTNLETMKSQVFLPMVQSMKGMGALSNAEGDKLTAAIGNLDTQQSEAQFKKNVTQIVKDLTMYRNRANQRPQGQATATTGSKPTVSNW